MYFLLYGEVGTVQAVDALVGAEPDVIAIAFSHAGDGESPGGGLLALEAATGELHDVESYAVDLDECLASGGDENGDGGLVGLIA